MVANLNYTDTPFYVVVVVSETSICTEFLPLADNHFEVITDGET